MSSPDVRRLSLNQGTTPNWPTAETIDGCARAGFDWIGLWRHKVEELGVTETARRLRVAGLRASSLCRGGFFPAGRIAASVLSAIDMAREALLFFLQFAAPVARFVKRQVDDGAAVHANAINSYLCRICV